MSWARLPGTKDEIDGVEQLFSGTCVRLSGLQATEARVAAALKGRRYLHVATHGFFADTKFRSAVLHGRAARTEFDSLLLRSPLDLCGLVFRRSVTEPKDGIMTGSEILDTDLAAAELVTLSACETGLGEFAGAAGDGVFSLQRAFHEAGAKTVVASLWKVHDAATRTLMLRFYHNLWQRGLGKLAALREAQRWILTNPGVWKIDSAREPWKMGNLRSIDGDKKRKRIDPRESKRFEDDPARTPFHFWAAFGLSGDWR